ncbi:radical SAM protein [bacterium]|nr:radical SAM protein [bacterium]
MCKANRIRSNKGVCRSGSHAVVASHNTHNGEEPPISGYAGSGTIFFSGCSGRCLFCQNYPISQLNTGTPVSDKRLAFMMLDLQKRGCHNINLVTPTHFLPSIVHAISIAVKSGLRLPIVYNTSGYERVEILELLNGIVDIYLPDCKYADDNAASVLSGFDDYVAHNRSALKEMFRQVGNLRIVNGIATKGLLVRHLILPDNLSGTETVLKFLAREISRNLYVSLMDQYFPAYRATNHAVLSRRINTEEYNESLEFFTACGLHNGWIQEHLIN